MMGRAILTYCGYLIAHISAASGSVNACCCKAGDALLSKRDSVDSRGAEG